MVLDEPIELRLLRLALFRLLPLLRRADPTSSETSFSSFAFCFTLSSEVSFRFTCSTRFTVFSSFPFMKLIRASTAYLSSKVPSSPPKYLDRALCLFVPQLQLAEADLLQVVDLLQAGLALSRAPGQRSGLVACKLVLHPLQIKL